MLWSWRWLFSTAAPSDLAANTGPNPDRSCERRSGRRSENSECRCSRANARTVCPEPERLPFAASDRWVPGTQPPCGDWQWSQSLSHRGIQIKKRETHFQARHVPHRFTSRVWTEFFFSKICTSLRFPIWMSGLPGYHQLQILLLRYRRRLADLAGLNLPACCRQVSEYCHPPSTRFRSAWLEWKGIS